MIKAELQRRATQISTELVALLGAGNRKIVFAESCTGGLLSAILTQHAGISRWLCGSAVTYQETTKRDWLNIDPELIERFSAVSQPVANQMAISVLERTSAADLALAITGHLESNAAADGAQSFVALAHRVSGEAICFKSARHLLNEDARVGRQWEAACLALEEFVTALKATNAVPSNPSENPAIHERPGRPP
jgi:PncC family amidohydrolase